MKMLKHIKTALLGSVTLLLITVSLRASAQPGHMVSFQLFYDQLSPYGEWVNDRDYGYIWLPNAGPNFTPYATNGHWVMTNYGNTWVSNYDWGWAPFHYGRWVHTDWYGWAWIPGYEWGPAWVSWRSGGGYYGWAPLGPRMSVGVNIHIPSHHWVFVPQRYITSHRIHRYYVPHRRYANIYNRTTIINNTYIYNNRTYVSGPSHRDVQRVTRSRVQVRDINSSPRPSRATVDSRSVNLYRPSVDRNTRTSARPVRATEASAVRTRTANRTTTQPAATRANTRSTTPPTANTRATTRRTTTQPTATRANTRSTTPPAATTRRTTTQPTATRANTRSTTPPAANTRANTRSSQRATSVERSSNNRSRATNSRGTTSSQSRSRSTR